MNLLASSYVDAHYKQYLETNPLLAVCVIGTGSHGLEQYLLQSEGQEYRMCVTALDSIEQLTTKSGEVHADSRGNIFKSDWCLKHQRTIHSCVVLCFDWNTFGQGNVPAEDLHVFEVAKQRLRFSNCKVVVACNTDSCTIDVNEPTFNAVRNEIKAVMGPWFVDMVVVGQESAAIRISAELRVVVVEASLNYHQCEIRRLRDQKKTNEQPESSVMIRTHFKMGWHCLCVRDHANAMKQFSKAYKVSKSLFPVHPTFEVRLCSSIVLFHLVSVTLSSGDAMQMNPLLLSDIISHIDWINQSFASEYSENCRNLAITLLSYLAAEWFEVLARKFAYLDTASRQDYFFAAAHCLIDLVGVVPRECCEELEIPAPPFVGTECSADAYANLALARVCKKSVGEKIYNLLEEAAGLGDLSARRNAERLYYQFICGDGSLLQPEKVLFCGLSYFIFNDCSSMLLEKNNYDKQGAQMDIYCLVHRCVDPTTPLAQPLYREKLKDYLKQLGDSTVALKYPYLGFCALFTVVPFFHQTSAESGHFSAFTLSLFTSSLIPITVEELKVTCATRNSKKIVEVECPGVYNLSASTPVDVHGGSVFRECGEYLCQLVEAKVVVDSFSFAICWSLTPGSWDSLLSLGANVQLHVRNPISHASIECPTVIEAVEGESVVIDIVINNNKENALQNCTLSFLSLPKFFSAKLFSDNGEECCAAPSKRDGLASFSIRDVPSWGSVMSAYNCSCLKSGLFRMLVFLNYSTAEYPDIEIRKTIDMSVDPPFTVSSTFIRSANWFSEGGHFLISRTDPAYEVNDSYILGKVKGNAEPSEYYELQKNETYLYYAVKESQEPVQVFTLSVGETLAFYVRVTYVGRNGITVHGADFIAFNELDIIHVSDGDMPCLLFESESVSVVVHSTLKEEVNFSPGFVRVRFSPQRTPDSLLVADLFLPEVTVERIPVTVTYCYPSSVLVSLPFLLEISICNTGTTSFAGRVSVDSSSLSFCYSGRVNWEVNLGPEESTKTAIQLIPIASGDIKLPPFVVERTGHSPFKCDNSLFVIVEPNVGYDCR